MCPSFRILGKNAWLRDHSGTFAIINHQRNRSPSMTAPDNVKSLGQRFEGNGEAYRSGNYNAAQLRNGFLNWFLEALGCLT
jgi:hypothetical protein